MYVEHSMDMYSGIGHVNRPCGPLTLDGLQYWGGSDLGKQGDKREHYIHQ
jgi:hypothetical protein